MRINAEKERIEKYKQVAQNCAKTYYIICKRLSIMNLEEVEHAQYILDYMRNVIERGHEFTKKHLYKALDTFNEKEIQNNDILKLLRILFEELKYTEDDYLEYIDHISQDPNQAHKVIYYRRIFDEFIGKLSLITILQADTT